MFNFCYSRTWNIIHTSSCISDSAEYCKKMSTRKTLAAWWRSHENQTCRIPNWKIGTAAVFNISPACRSVTDKPKLINIQSARRPSHKPVLDPVQNKFYLPSAIASFIFKESILRTLKGIYNIRGQKNSKTTLWHMPLGEIIPKITINFTSNFIASETSIKHHGIHFVSHIFLW